MHALLPPIYEYLLVIFETPLPALPPALPRSCPLPSTRDAPPVPCCAECPGCGRSRAVTTVPRAIPSWGLSRPVSAPGPQPCPECHHAQLPCQVQGKDLLAAGHSLVPRAAGAHLPGVLLRVLPSPSCAPRAPRGVPLPHVLKQKLCPGQGGLPAAPSRGIQGISHRCRLPLTCSNGCAVRCGLPHCPTACADPAVILFQRSPEGTRVPLNPSHLPGLHHNLVLALVSEYF